MKETLTKSKNTNKLTFKQVEEYINSHKFIELLAKCEVENEDMYFNICSELIGVAIDYADIFSRSNESSIKEMEEILTGVIEKEKKQDSYKIENVFYNKILRDCKIKPNSELNESEDAVVKEKILEYLEYKNTQFHAFNGAFLDSIKGYGINPNKKMYKEEQNLFDSLYKKYGAEMLSSHIDADEGNVSYSTTASVSYYYAFTSPQWFSKLCGQNNYIKRDYDASRQNVLHIAKSFNFSNEDEKILMDAFERCWQSFAKNEIYVAITPKDLVYGEKEKEMIRESFKNLNINTSRRVFNVSFGLRDKGVLGRSSSAINTGNTIFFKLPNFNELTKEVEIQKQKELKNDSNQTL